MNNQNVWSARAANVRSAADCLRGRWPFTPTPEMLDGRSNLADDLWALADVLDTIARARDVEIHIHDADSVSVMSTVAWRDHNELVHGIESHEQQNKEIADAVTALLQPYRRT